MNTWTCVGPVVDELGQAARREFSRTTTWQMPADRVRRRQANTIRVDQEHDHREVGEVVHLERSGRHLWAVAHVDIDPDTEFQTFWSAEATFDRGTGADAVLDWLSLTYHPAHTGLLRLQYYPGKLDRRDVLERWRDFKIDSGRKAILERAAENVFHRRGGPLIVGDDPSEFLARQPAGPVRWSAPYSGVISVS